MLQGSKRIDTKEFQTTFLEPDKSKRAKTYLQVLDAIKSKAVAWAAARRLLEDDWEECWSQYLSNWRGNHIIDRNSLFQVGDVANDYRHKIPITKAFEVVETVNSYLQNAFFPTRNWFTMKPKNKMGDTWQEDTTVINELLLNKLEEAGFREYWDCFCRQACVVGTSVLALPWQYYAQDSYKNILQLDGSVKATPYTRVRHNSFGFEVVDMFDFFLDFTSRTPRQGDCLRRLVKTRGEVIRLIQSGEFPLGDINEVAKTPTYQAKYSFISDTKKANMEYVQGINNYSDTDEIELIEYWGTVKVEDVEYLDIRAVIMEHTVLAFEPNPYWGGKPFIVGTLINNHQTPYGTGLLQPNLGSLHMMYVNQNHRLDVDELTVDPMWLLRSDGSINPGDVFTAPGRVIQVEDPETDLVPLPMQVSSLQNNLTDEQILEERVNRSTGIGDYVGVGIGRDAERVTAREVEAQQNAGGNRLGRYHKHLEDTALREALIKAYEYCQQFVTEDETVRLQKTNRYSMGDDYDYFSVGPKELENEMDIYPVGASHVVDKEFELRQHIDFYTFMQGNPQLAQYMNWKEVAKDLAKRLIKDDWTKYVNIPEENNTMGVDSATGQSPLEQMGQMSDLVNGGGGGQPASPPQPYPIPEDSAQQGSYDNQQFNGMLAQNPELARKMTEEYVNQQRNS